MMPASTLDRSSLVRAMSRRRCIGGLLALGAGGVLAAGPRFASNTLAASGQLPGARLTELATHSGWRRTWDLVVPLLTGPDFPRTVLLYDRAAGEATLIALDESGGFREVRTFFNWRTTWDIMVPSGFPQTAGVAGLFAYDRAAGHVTTLQIDATGGFQELQNASTWRKSWTSFVPVGPSGLLGYERGSGYATLLTLDRNGLPREVRSYNDWGETWDLMANGPFVTAETPGRDVLLYDRIARQAAGFSVATNGETSTFGQYFGWRSTWSAITGGQFRFRGDTGSMTADLMLFDREAQELEFVDIGAGSALTSVLLTTTPAFNAWTTGTAVGPNLLLLYDRANGTGAFYVTDRTPAPVPTPTPTPTITPTDRVTVRLQQGEGNRWHTYTGSSGDPVSGGSRNAYITGVKNTSDKRIGLIHVDRAERRTGPVFIKAPEVSDRFNGMLVAGDWEARMTGSQAEAPPRVTLEVRYEVR